MLKAGFSRVDVTPPLGSYISGYFEERFAEGVLDPIQLNALAVSDGTVTDLIIISDFIGVDRKYCEIIRQKIVDRTGMDGAHIMLSALHQHTSVCISDKEPRVCSDSAYMDLLYRRYCDVAKMALDDMGDATLGFAIEETAEPIAFIRRYLMTDGPIIGHPFGRKDEIVRRIGDADNRVRLLRFMREGKNDIAFVNFCTHPDVIGGKYFSADWPGFVRRYVEQDLAGVSCLLLNGVQGDSNHCDYLTERRHGYAHSAHMGRVIADTVERIWDRTEPQTDVTVKGGMDSVFLQTRTDGAERYEECKELLAAHREGRLAKRPSGAELGDAGRVVRMRTAPLFQQLPVTVMKLGRFCIVGFGGEPFTHYATAVQEKFPELTVLTSCCCNGDEGYLPTPEIFAEGGYEASASPFPTNLENECVAMAEKLIRNL